MIFGQQPMNAMVTTTVIISMTSNVYIIRAAAVFSVMMGPVSMVAGM
jgi:hypothetical protein